MRCAVIASLVAALLLPASASADAGAACVNASEKGIDARERGALRTARAHFVTCAADACPKSLRVDCARWLDEVDASLPSIVVGAKDARGADVFDVRVRVDGEPVEDVQAGRPIVLDPGPHVVHFERGRPPALEAQDVKVLLRTGEHNRTVLATMRAPTDHGADTPAPPPRPAPSGGGVPVGTWVFGGIGVVGLGMFGTFAILGSNEKSRVQGLCSPGCTDAEVAGARNDYLVADIALGVGIVSLGIATYLLLTNHGTAGAGVAGR
jgi:hypothetical protein